MLHGNGESTRFETPALGWHKLARSRLKREIGAGEKSITLAKEKGRWLLAKRTAVRAVVKCILK